MFASRLAFNPRSKATNIGGSSFFGSCFLLGMKLLFTIWSALISLPMNTVVFCSHPPLLSPKAISFIPCGAKTQKKETMPYPRCGEHFKHSDYRADGIWHCFFFRLFPLLGSVSIVLTALNHHFSKKFASQKPHISAVFAGF